MIVSNNVGLYFDDEKPDLDSYLEHYGVPGMKWGVRKDQKSGAHGGAPSVTGALMRKRSDRIVRKYNESKYMTPNKRARRASKALNEMDRVRANAKFDREYYEKKASKAKEKGNVDKYEKNKKKALNNARLENQAKKNIEDIKKDQRGKYDISEKDGKRMVVRGRNILAAYGLTTGGTAAGVGATLANTTFATRKANGLLATVDLVTGKTAIYQMTYTVMSRPYEYIAYGAAGGIALGVGVAAASAKRVKGTKYKVKPKPIK